MFWFFFQIFVIFVQHCLIHVFLNGIIIVLHTFTDTCLLIYLLIAYLLSVKKIKKLIH